MAKHQFSSYSCEQLCFCHRCDYFCVEVRHARAMRFYTRKKRSCMVLFVLVLVSFCLCLDCICFVWLFCLFCLLCSCCFVAFFLQLFPALLCSKRQAILRIFQLSLRLTFQIQLFRRPSVSIKSVMSKEQKNSCVFSFAWSAQVWFNIIWEVAKGQVGFRPFFLNCCVSHLVLWLGRFCFFCLCWFVKACFCKSSEDLLLGQCRQKDFKGRLENHMQKAAMKRKQCFNFFSFILHSVPFSWKWTRYKRTIHHWKTVLKNSDCKRSLSLATGTFFWLSGTVDWCEFGLFWADFCLLCFVVSWCYVRFRYTSAEGSTLGTL